MAGPVADPDSRLTFIPCQLGQAFKPGKKISWYSKVEVDLPEVPELFVNADHAVAVHKLAGERGEWQLAVDDAYGGMVLTLRNGEGIIGLVKARKSAEAK